MEAVPRLPMQWFALKSSPEGTSFVNLKKYIAECYHENPESYSKEVYALETLRNTAMRPAKDITGCATLKRYYCQLHSLANRFPHASEKNLFTFTWKDLYVSNITETSDIRHEMAAVLFNVAALHTQLGASVDRSNVDGMKLACTHFQCAAWSFGELKDKYQGINNNADFMTSELLLFMQQVSFAQAQECILEKSLIDNRKSAIVAKVTSQIINYYGAALLALLTGGDDGSITDVVGAVVFKEWKKYVRFKISYLNSILFLYQGQQAEEQQKMGERVALYQAAWDKLEEAKKESKGMSDQKEITESLTFTADVVEGKRKAAKNENEFIYHEAVPELSDIAAVQGANLVNGIGFSITDPEVFGEDIFARLIPMKAHEASSLYSEEKAQILRKFGTRIEEKDNELTTFMSSLNIDHLNISEERSSKIPQGIVDRCASLNAKTNAIPDLIASMSNLAEICADVETNLKEIKELLNEEDLNEKQYQQKSGVHRSNAHITELSREFQKYLEAHQKAGDSNNTLRRAMELHVNNLRILSKPLQEIQSSVPKLSGDVNESCFHEIKLLLNKVNEMKAQRAQFHADLRIAINNDDVTSKIIAYGEDKEFKKLFKNELAKHDKITTLIDQNLGAQKNILSALTEAYAKCAPLLKTLGDVKHKKENFYSSLAASYDVYEDLLAKSAKGLEFYKKLQGNVQKLLARVRAARDVQDEERHQRLNSSVKVTKSNEKNSTIQNVPAKSGQPKLKDYLKSGKPILGQDNTYIPSIRPNPLGSEAPSASACVNTPTPYYTSQQVQPLPTDPPPPYTPQSTQYPEASGYVNPIYQNNQIYDQTTKTDYGYGGYDPQAYYQNQGQIQSYQNPTITQNTSQLPQTNQYQYRTSNNSGYQYPQTSDGQSSLYQQPNMMPQQQTAIQPAGTLSTQQSNMMPQQQATMQSSGTLSTQQQQQISQSFQSYPQYEQTMYQQQMPYQPQQTFKPSASPASTTTHPTSGSWSAAGITNQMDNLSLQNSQQSNPYYPSYQSQYDQTSQDQQYAYSQQSSIATSTLAPTNVSSYNLQSSYSSHPGYVFNQMTGEYEYGSGYQFDQNGIVNAYSQYTTPAPDNASNTTDSSNMTALGQTYANQYIEQQVQAHDQSVDSNNSSYYNVPYGYQSTADCGNYQQPSLPVVICTTANASNPTGMTYMFSNSNNLTSTTISGGYSDTSITSNQEVQHLPQQHNVQLQQQSPQSQQIQQQNTQALQTEQQNSQPLQPQQQTDSPSKPDKKPNIITSKKSSNIDLLSDIDFSMPTPVIAPLQPQVATPKSESPASSHVAPLQPQPTKIEAKKDQPSIIADLNSGSKFTETNNISDLDTKESSSVIDRKLSCDNISICSDLSSLDHSFDWESVSVRHEQQQQTQMNQQHSVNTENSPKYKDPFSDPKILKYFHKEVERYEKSIESLNIKMLNGNTPLVNKWKELQDLLVKDEAKRTTSVGKLFPEKNRSTDCIPYDHARVVLARNTDDYINAAYVKDLGAGCPTFILAQTPLQNTVNDFWSMIWSQKARTVVCLHTPNEILDTFWPQEFNKEVHFDDFSVILVKQFDLSHCIELNLKLTMNGADAILDLSLIQIKAWTKSSPTQILGIAQNILVAYKQRSQEFKSNAPLIMNCLTGSERSGLIALAICTILATQTKRPILINVVDVWYRICSQRKSALRDTNNLQLSMQIVLCQAHDLLNKRGIMTSYQMKTAQTAIAIEKEEIKDPLNDLDPLWKLKQK